MGETFVEAASYFTLLQLVVMVFAGFFLGFTILYRVPYRFIIEFTGVVFYMVLIVIRYVEDAENWQRLLSSLILWLVFSVSIGIGDNIRRRVVP